MARYTYRCFECEFVWTSEYPMGEAPPREPCPECGKLLPVARKYEAPGVVYKGKGWTTKKGSNDE